MTQRVREVWEDELDPMHRALLDQVRELEPAVEDRIRAEAMAAWQLAGRLRAILREQQVTIPAGTPVVACRFCGARVCRLPVYAKQYRSAFAVDGTNCRAPTVDRRGQGYEHLADQCGGLWDIEHGYGSPTYHAKLAKEKNLPRATEDEAPLLPAAPRQESAA